MQLMETIGQLQTERDHYVGQIQEEGRAWKDKTEQLLTQVSMATDVMVKYSLENEG